MYISRLDLFCSFYQFNKEKHSFLLSFHNYNEGNVQKGSKYSCRVWDFASNIAFKKIVKIQ